MLKTTGKPDTLHPAPCTLQHSIKGLLLLLCQHPFDQKNRDTLSKLIGEITDWSQLTNLINDHGIIALAHHNITTAGLAEVIPPGILAVLENGYLRSLVRNAWLTEHWKEVNAILSSAGIKHIVLKGMALEHTIYGSLGLRQMNDNDILLKREDAFRAWELLQKEGFTSEAIKSGLHKKILLDIGKHLPELYKDGYSLEIHHKLTDDIIFEETGSKDPFEDAVEINIAGTKALSLSNEKHLRYLISHFEKHKLEGNCQLRLYADILLLDKTSIISVPDHFIYNPKQEMKSDYRKAAFKETIRAIPVKHRIRFITGDIFPSLNWMKERYKCNGVRAMLYYPVRIAKLGWLM